MVGEWSGARRGDHSDGGNFAGRVRHERVVHRVGEWRGDGASGEGEFEYYGHCGESIGDAGPAEWDYGDHTSSARQFDKTGDNIVCGRCDFGIVDELDDADFCE